MSEASEKLESMRAEAAKMKSDNAAYFAKLKELYKNIYKGGWSFENSPPGRRDKWIKTYEERHEIYKARVREILSMKPPGCKIDTS